MRTLATLLLAACGLMAAAVTQAATPTEITDRPGGLEVRRDGLRMRVEALRADIIRVRIGREDTLPEDASWAVTASKRAARAQTKPFAESGRLGFRTEAATVSMDRASGRLEIADASGHVLVADAQDRPLTLDPRGFLLRKALPADEHVFGLGDKPGPLDRRGQSFAMWNTDAYGWQESSSELYKDIPFYIGVDKAGLAHGLFLDNTFRTAFDFGRTDRRAIEIRAEDGPIDYYVLTGPSPREVVQAWAWLTGTPAMPPLWALGFQQSRYSYMTETELRAVAARLRAEHIPADALYLDIDYQDHNRPFTVDRSAFPDLARLTGDLKAQGFKLVLITDLHIAHWPNAGYVPFDSGMAGDHFVRNAEGSTYVGAVWPGPSVFPEFTRQSTRTWWGGLYADFARQGVAGFWNDMNEPAVFSFPSKTMPDSVVHRIEEPGFAPRGASHGEIHNIFGMLNSRATYEGLIKLRPDERPFVLTRASYAGGQKWAATWTGDNNATWNHLRLMIPMLQNLGVSGFTWSGADVGGFAGSPPPDLLTKWIEIAAFTPLFRDHAAKGTTEHEPYADGAAQTDIRRRFIEARYRLLPYLYTLADEAARTGLPLMRPLFLEFPHTAGWSAEGEFMLGPDLLIAAPPMPETRDAWNVHLPSEGWYDFWTGRPVAAKPATAADAPAGDRVLSETPALERLPVFVRPGAILPSQPLVQSTLESPAGPLQLDVYPGPDCRGALYADDGHSLGRERGRALRQSVSCTVAPDGVEVRFGAREGDYRPWWKSVHVVVHDARLRTPDAVLADPVAPVSITLH